MTEKKTEIFSKLAALFIIAGPVFDILTALTEKFMTLPISVGILVRFAFVGVIGIYLLFFYKDRHRILLRVLFLVVSLYGIVHVLLNAYLFGAATFFENVKMFFKTFYFVYSLLFFYALFRSSNFRISDKLLTVVYLEYTVCILLAVLTGTSFNTYPYKISEGFCGWFFAGNEVAAIVAMLSCVAIAYGAFRANVVLGIAIMALTAFAGTYIGTKVAFLAIVGITVISVVFYIIKAFVLKTPAAKQAVLRVAVLPIALMLLFSFNSPIKQNTTTLATDHFQSHVTDELNKDEEQSSSDMTASDSDQAPDEEEDPTSPDDDSADTQKSGRLYYIVNWLLSNRLEFSKTAFDTYENSSVVSKLLGLGYNYKSVTGKVVTRTIEMDVLALIINNGVIGALLYMVPVFVFAVICIKKFFKNIKHIMKMQNILSYICAIFITLGCAILSGHVFVAPAVSIYFAIIIIKLFAALETEDFKQEAAN